MKKRRNKASVKASRWVAYAVAGATTLTGQTAQADLTAIDLGIEFVPFNDDGPVQGTVFTHNLGNNASLDFSVVDSSTGEISVEGIGAASVADVSFPTSTALDLLTYGQNISTLNFGTLGILGYYTFGIRETGFFAFQFDVGSGTQFGFGEVFIRNGAPELVQIVEAGPGHTLFTGQQAVPEPGSLAFLALGAVGLVAWRRNREIV